MHIQGVCFDLDGTLLDTLEDIALAANAVLRRWNLPEHPVDQYRTFVGEGASRLIEQILPQGLLDEPPKELLLAAFEEEYGQQWHIKTTLYPGVAEMLDALSAARWPLTILSNKPDAFTQQCVHHFLGDWSFRLVHGQRSGVSRKPDPAGLLGIAAELQLPPASLCMVGDTRTDMETAVRAGAVPVGVTWGFRDAQELQESGAHRLLDRPQELPVWLASQRT